VGAWRGKLIGAKTFLLKDLIERGGERGEFRLDNGAGVLEAEVRWVGYFDQE
jgi:hypothetical protein